MGGEIFLLFWLGVEKAGSGGISKLVVFDILGLSSKF
jgi:hypothetical protein